MLLILFCYMAQITFGKNCVAHYLVTIGHAFMCINTHFSKVVNFCMQFSEDLAGCC